MLSFDGLPCKGVTVTKHRTDRLCSIGPDLMQVLSKSFADIIIGFWTQFTLQTSLFKSFCILGGAGFASYVGSCAQ